MHLSSRWVPSHSTPWSSGRRTPPGAVEMDCPAPRGIPEQHASQKRPHANKALLGSGGPTLKVHCLVVSRYTMDPLVSLLS